MAPSFDEIPGVERSDYGEAMYREGRELVARGLDLSQVMWDADEVLWDWVMSGPRLLGQIPLALFGWLGHREYIAVRPGMMELLWGMRHEALERGGDPNVRIWTSGYPWRLWKILREIEGFDELLGPPLALSHRDSTLLERHPRVMTRTDYVAIVGELLDPAVRAERLATLPEPARSAIAEQIARRPDDSGYKIPELAVLAGKPAFRSVRVLVDDVRRNVGWFLATGRSAIHVRSRTPRIVFDTIPHSAWSPRRFLERTGHGAAASIAAALESMAADGVPRILEARVREADGSRPNRIITIDVPNEVLWREWITPMRDLRRAMRAAASTAS